MEIDAPQVHLLPLWEMLDFIENEISVVPIVVRCQIDRAKIVFYILEELNVALSDRDATSPIDQAVRYLTMRSVSHDKAQQVCYNILHLMLDLVTGYFPNISYFQLSAARFVMVDDFTLKVTLRESS